MTIKLPYVVPGSPGTPRIMQAFKDAVSLKWTEPMHTGGSSITGYFIEYKDKNSVLWMVRFDISNAITFPLYQMH